MVDRSVPESQYRSQMKITKKLSKSAPCRSSSGTAPSRPLEKNKDLKLHKLIFEEGGLLDGTKVTYRSDEKQQLFGYKTSNGILCSCCNETVSPSKFEVHAGKGSHRKPYSYICLENKISLHEVALYLSKRRSAKDGGEVSADDMKLWLCDGCRTFFHKDSASSPKDPPSNWHCNLCQGGYKEKCSKSDVSRRVAGDDHIERTAECDIRIPEENISCFLCSRSDHDCNFQFGAHTIVVCHQCEKDYHMCCLKKHRMSDLKVKPMGKWFCCSDCKSISSHFRTVIDGQQKEFMNSLLEPKRKKLDNTNKIVRWRLLLCSATSPKDKLLRDELLLSKAYTILEGCFDQVVDSVSGRDLLRDMVFRKTGQHSMYCAVVTVDSSVVAAGLFRVLGRNIAVLPLAATAVDSQRQGYCRQLISGIEDRLKACGVHRLVLPATKQAKSMWMKKFGFGKMSKEEKNYYEENCWRMIHFSGTTMLQKVIDNKPQSKRKR